MEQENETFTPLSERYNAVYAIIAPPRTASTAFARVFWEHPSIGFYCHEPFDLIYHRRQSLRDVLNAMQSALNLSELFQRSNGRDLIVKEMTFQVGDAFRIFASAVSRPLIFLIRDPRQSIFSRMEKRRAGGQPPIFPLNESGWNDLEWQLTYCREENIPYLLVDSADFRNDPQTVFPAVFEKMQLSFSPEMLSWQPLGGVKVGQIWEEQSHWYRRVLESSGIQPAEEATPAIDLFPRENGFRKHVEACVEMYIHLQNDHHLIRPRNLNRNRRNP